MAAYRRAGLERYLPAERAVTLLEFGAVGVTGAVLNYLVFLATVDAFSYLLAGTMAFVGAIAWTFAWNWAITFDPPSDRLLRSLGRYLGVYAVGYLIYTLILVASIRGFAAPHWAGSLGAITGGGVWNYLGCERYALS